MSDTVTLAYGSALDGMQRSGPMPIHPVAAMFGNDQSLTDGTALLAHLQSAGPEDALRQQFAQVLAGWDHVDSDAVWAAGTGRNTAERRAAIVSTLQLDPTTQHLVASLFPHATAPIVIADDWKEWRTAERRGERDFYWSHYRRYLLDKGWDAGVVAGLDHATEDVVRRLSDPTREVAYQAKGLVVGYVQSGKTANFTGVIAKAVDAGYRLVIVLTGTTNMLRAQTQRRLDIELVGRENLEQEISAHDSRGHEYQDDTDWEKDRFVRHGGRPSDIGYPDIRRLSTRGWDYRRLRQGFMALDFPRRERTQPLFAPVNLYTSDARLVVAKKNKTVLQDLVADLGRIRERLGEVPVLIIDDESDQASVNTTSPKKWAQDSKDRTAINRLIGQLLSMMPRAQYVGYTATPYANVFVDPSDVEDIFPRDFLVSLARPVAYMGAEDFHDFDTDIPLSERTLENSQELRHVRLLDEEPQDIDLRSPLDMYLLTGAVKLHRQRHGHASYQHHTMLVHEAMSKAVHRDTADVINAMWNSGQYRAPAGLARLRALYERDVLPVSAALGTDLPTPVDFDDLRPDIAAALDKISPPDQGSGPVIVVNSDKDLERQQESLDFDMRPIWRILVGGNSLARGFTVEGLTVTYYRRVTKQVDTLMQMGRWFGFRPGFRDLVRIYTTGELHEMFAAACKDEEYLRAELRRYSQPTDGERQITPRQIPPLIAQHRPDLRPTGRNKMWNATLVEKSSPGEPMEPVAYPNPGSRTGDEKTRANAAAWLPVLSAATTTVRFKTVRASKVLGVSTIQDTGKFYSARIAEMDHREVVEVLRSLRWLSVDTFKPELKWLSGLSPEQLKRWLIIFPHQVSDASLRTIHDQGPFSIFRRVRTSTGSLRAVSESRHRNAASRIAGLGTPVPDPEADRLYAPATGAMIVYPNVEADVPDARSVNDGLVTMAFQLVTPVSSMPTSGKLIKWQTRNSADESAIVVDAE
ncbi:Z1 domain-containing protein [Micromonospora sp. DT41]|uniref:Z1 domain-containing protein n=1 Tax=Micromonospora sp. DT41 TaxID=3393437 RepID=UPI003CED29C4